MYQSYQVFTSDGFIPSSFFPLNQVLQFASCHLPNLKLKNHVENLLKKHCKEKQRATNDLEAVN
jgi:hypothetical protein